MSRKEKHQYLLENGWWAHYHMDCWFENIKDPIIILDEDGIINNFRPEEEGITLEEAYKIVTKQK